MMAGNSSTVVMPPPLELNKEDMGFKVFDTTKMIKREKLPKEFAWPAEDLEPVQQGRNEPLIDLEGFLKGDKFATAEAAKLVETACLTHGFFQICNHGVSLDLLSSVQDYIDPFFQLPLSRKLTIQKKPNTLWGYSGAHSDRFAAKLPWKEMLTIAYHYDGPENEVTDYFKTALGQDFEETGLVYQKYCEAMKKLSLKLLQLIAVSLDLEDTSYYKNHFEDGVAILRCNYYPTCQEYGLTLGVGPHCDPTSVTILHQDLVGGLDVFTNDKWYSIHPQPGALVINLGDTFRAFSNGNYKSSLHRGRVNCRKARTSWAFFLNPNEEVVRPPEDLVARDGGRKYPDFKWSQFLWFTQNRHRADDTTLTSFVEWLESSEAK